ncbi:MULTISPECIES: DUF5988 family protein [unclassified Kitasatospora]|uniref:DUF5988 family protein n=1 Tax=unclassified Kitasatospora TaxID=2633591 RepID=UPI0033CD5371
MRIHVTDSGGAERDVVLEGRPEILPNASSDHSTAMSGAQVVVTRYGQHHHFEQNGGTEYVDGRLLPVFSWTYSTSIAE